MTLNAVFGTEVSIVCEAVRSVSFFRSGVRLSNGSRTTRGPRLKNTHCQLSPIPDVLGSPLGFLYEPLKRLVLHITMLVIQSLEQAICQLCRGVLVMRKIR